MRTIDAHLCVNCARLLHPWLSIEHIETYGVGPRECVWCERARDAGTYRIRLPEKE